MFTKFTEANLEGFTKPDGGTVIAPDLSKPTTIGLAHVLENLDKYFQVWSWRFVDPTCCAIGVAKRMWGEDKFPGEYESHKMADAFGIPREIAKDIFCDASTYPGAFRDLVPIGPRDVAARLRELV